MVTLAWDPGDATETGFNLYMGFASGQETNQTNVGNVTTWTVQVTSGVTYFFVVTAYNDAGESPPSNEISYTAP